MEKTFLFYLTIFKRDVEGLVPGQEVAVKIYCMDMTTGFKDRLKYVDGEFRYRHTPTQNSRKAIKVWAEKELRNLKRYATHKKIS